MVGQYFAGIQGDRTVEWRFFFHTDIILDNSSLEDCQIFGEQETTDFGCRITRGASARCWEYNGFDSRPKLRLDLVRRLLNILCA